MGNIANYKQNFFTIVTAFILSFILISFSAKFTLNFKSLYYFDISYLNISENSGYSENEIKTNYNYIVDFVASHKNTEFNLPSLNYSEQGKIHFEDVKKVFNFMDNLMYILLILLVFLVLYALKKKNFKFLRYTTYLLIILPLATLIPFLINFDYSFTIFHEILFSNDYWIFNPIYDPIITILPEEFFFHSLGVIVIFLILSSILCNVLYKNINK
ncbi:TIGR01906 family membrane protein [Clostridium sp. DL1XJH146]